MQLYSLNGKHTRYGHEIIRAYLLDKPTLPKFTEISTMGDHKITIDTQSGDSVRIIVHHAKSDELIGEFTLNDELYNVPRYFGLNEIQDRLDKIDPTIRLNAVGIYEILTRKCIDTWLTEQHTDEDSFFLSVYRRLDSSFHLYKELGSGNQICYDYIPSFCDNGIDYQAYLLEESNNEDDLNALKRMNSVLNYALVHMKTVSGDETYQMMGYYKILYEVLVKKQGFKWIPCTTAIEPKDKLFTLSKGITLMYAYLPYLNKAVREHEDHLDLFNGFSQRWLMLYYYFCDKDVFNAKTNETIQWFFDDIEKKVFKDNFIQWLKCYDKNGVQCDISRVVNLNVHFSRPSRISFMPGTLPGGFILTVGEAERSITVGSNVSPEFILSLIETDHFHSTAYSHAEDKTLTEIFTVPSSEWPLTHVLRNIYTKYIEPTDIVLNSATVH